MNDQQQELDVTNDFLNPRKGMAREYRIHPFPKTRFQGSKAKIIPWIYEKVSDLHFDTALDLFGGTGSVAHLFKTMGKAVDYNDLLKFNHIIGKALIENSHVTLGEKEIKSILSRKEGLEYPSFISRTFKDVFYLDEENEWLDMVITNIGNMDDEYKRSIAYFGLFQACIMKRPYNLFHRSNLYIRTSDVKRDFGNKTTWDTPFYTHFKNVITEANATVFDNGRKCSAYNFDSVSFPTQLKYDLVYMDPPYVSGAGIGVDYLDFYHFLEGMVEYDKWSDKILTKYKHLPLKGRGENPWANKKTVFSMFESVLKKFQESIIVVSYRNDGVPSIEQLAELLSTYKKNVQTHKISHKYVLSKNGESHEVLLIGK